LYVIAHIALPVTPDVGNLSSKFERYMAFRFQINGEHRTDVTRNAAIGMDGRIKTSSLVPRNDIRNLKKNISKIELKLQS